MALYTVYVLSAANVSLSDGAQLSGYSQGDAAHLPGHTITLNAPNWQPVSVSDSDGFFADNDPSQSLGATTTLDGKSYAAGRVVEAEYTITVEDPDGHQYKIIGFNINETGSPYASYGTVEGLAFVGPPGSWPPLGTPLTVVAHSEGPPDANTAGAQVYESLVSPICFVTGTRIATPLGARRVETLVAGDLVTTLGNGAQPLLWTGATEVGGTPRARIAAFRAVRIAAGALAPGLPQRPLLVSRQHKLLVGGWKLDLNFGLSEALVPAFALLGQPGITEVLPEGRWSYHHLLCVRHEILLAEGAAAESFQPGPVALASLAPKTRRSLERLLARLPARPAARPTLTGREASLAL